MELSRNWTFTETKKKGVVQILTLNGSTVGGGRRGLCSSSCMSRGSWVTAKPRTWGHSLSDPLYPSRPTPDCKSLYRYLSPDDRSFVGKVHYIDVLKWGCGSRVGEHPFHGPTLCSRRLYSYRDTDCSHGHDGTDLVTVSFLQDTVGHPLPSGTWPRDIRSPNKP